MKKLLIFTLFTLFSLNLYAQVPANDECENAQAVALPSSGSLCLNSTTTNATSDGSITCDTDVNGPGNEVWFTFIASNANNSVTVTPNGTSPISNVVITLKTSDCDANFYDICNSGTGANPVTSILGLTPGTQVWVSVESNGGNDGDFQICINSTPPSSDPGNTCGVATNVCDKSTISYPSLAGFSASGGVQPSCFTGMFGAIPPRKDVWIKFTVGVTGTLEWFGTVLGANTEYDWALYDITSSCPGTEVACNYRYSGATTTFGMSAAAGNCTTNDFCPPVTVTAGRTYAILIDNFSQNDVGFSMDWGGTFQMGTASIFSVTPQTACSAPLTVNITNNSVGATSHLWNFGDGTTSTAANPGTHTYTSTGDYLISLAVTGNGCTSVISQRVNLNSGPVMTVTPPRDTICAGETSNLSAVIALGTPYNDRQFSSSVNTAIPNNSAAGLTNALSSTGMLNTTISTGTVQSICFTINHTNHSDIGRGPTPDAVTITVSGNTYNYTPLPLPNVNGTRTYCFPQTVLNAINAAGGNANTTWTIKVADNRGGGGGTGSLVSWNVVLRDFNAVTGYSWSPTTNMTNSTTLTPTVSPTTNTTYTLTSTDLFGCTNSYAVPIVVQTGNVTANVPSVTPVCVGATIGATNFTSTPAGATYSWTNSNTAIGLAASGTGNVPSFTATNSGTATITVTPTLNGCAGNPSTYNITVNTLDNASFSYPSQTVCVTGGNQSPTITGLTGGTFSSSSGGLSLNTTTGVINPSTSTLGGPYTVTYTTNGSCPNSSTFDVTITSSPSSTFNYSGPYCQNAGTATVALAGGASGGTFTSTAGLSLNAATGAVNLNTSTPGTYEVTNTIAAGGGCAESISTASITINALPTVTASASNNAICNDGSSSTVLSAVGASTYVWDNSIGAGNNISVSPTVTTTYNVTGTDANNCQNTASVTVTVNPLPTVIASTSTSAICNDGTSSATISASGANTYVWDNGIGAGNNVSVSPTSTTTYNVVGTDANNCQNTASVTITVNQLPTVSANATSTSICNGESTTLSASGASTYVWDNGIGAGNNITILPENTTTYVVTGTDANNCQNTSSVTVTVNPVPAMTSTNNAVLCSGLALNIGLTSNIASSYTWVAADNANVTGESLTTQTTSTINNTLTNTSTTAQVVAYTVTPTSTTGSCVGTPQTVNVTVNPAPAMTSTNNAVLCSGLALNIGLTSNIASSYTWVAADNANVTGESLTTQTTSTINNTLTNTSTTAQVVAYTVIPTSTTGSCVGTPQTVNVTVNPAPAMTSTNNAVLCSGLALNIGLTSNIASSYTWVAADNANVTGESLTTQTTSTINNTLTNTSTTAQVVAYTVTPTSTTGSCVGTPQTVNVTVDPTPSISGTLTLCEGGNNQLSGSGTPSGTTPWVSTNTSIATIDNNGLVTAVAVGTSSITYTENTGCSRTVTVTVTSGFVADFTYNNSYCATGTATPSFVNGGSAGTFSSTSGLVFSNAATGEIDLAASTPGSYTITNTIAADGSCPEVSNTFGITINPLPTITAVADDNAICIGENTNITANGGVTYVWTSLGNNQTFNVNPTTTTTYEVTGTDANSCSNVATVIVTVNALPTVNASATANVICLGDESTISASGATSYEWNQGLGAGNNFTVSPTTTTTYSVEGTDANGCKNTANVTVNVNQIDDASFTYTSSTICVTGTVVNPTITGLSGGTFTVSPSGLSINSTTGEIDPTTSTLETYTITYTTNGDCPNSETFTVTVTAAPQSTFNYAGPYCQVAGTSATVTLASGSSGGVFSSTSGLVINSTTGEVNIETSTAGTYTVTNSIAAQGGCAESVSTTQIVINALPAITAQADDNSICNGESTNITANGGVTYVWTGLGNNQTFNVNPTTTTTYEVTGTDANSCSNTATITVIVNDLPTVSAFSTVSAICLGSETIISASGANTYEWNQGLGVGNNFTVSPSTNTTYSVEGTDANGCKNTATVTVTVNSLPTVLAGSDINACVGSTVTLSGSGATTYTWDNGVTNGVSFTTTSVGTTVYTVTGTDDNNCSNTATVSVIVREQPLAGFTLNTAYCQNEGAPTPVLNTGAQSGVFSASPAGLSIDPSTGQINLSASTTGTYTITNFIAADNGCPEVAETFEVRVKLVPTAEAGNSIVSCVPALKLAGNEVTDATYAWASATATIANANLTNPDVTVIQGLNKFLYTVDLEGCRSTDSVFVEYIVVKADFEASTYEGDAELSVNFENKSTDATSYIWNFANSTNESTETDPSTVFVEEGTYKVLLTARNGECVDTISKVIKVNAVEDLFIPNVFSPNGDGVNDTYKVRGGGFTEFKAYIFNRWGNPIKELNSADEVWDGKTKGGNDVSEGVYFIRIIAKRKGEDVDFKGTVTVVK
jgi:gliding motility-associated-like protein